MKIKDKSPAIGVGCHHLKPAERSNPMMYMSFSKGQGVNVSFIKRFFVH
jgi:hypothetical protein